LRAGKKDGAAASAAVWARFRGKEHLLNPTTFNMRAVREAVIPAANGHLSAAALARFYAGLVSTVDGVPRLLTAETVDDCLRCADFQVGATASAAICAIFIRKFKTLNLKKCNYDNLFTNRTKSY
jgi:hypothetical protein